MAGFVAAPVGVSAQSAAPTPATIVSETRPVITILTQPTDTWVRLKGKHGHAQGRVPFDMPGTFHGRFTVDVKGEGVARTRGRIEVPRTGGPALLLSEPRGMSFELLVRSLNAPGVPAMTSGRFARGTVFATAAVGGLGAGVRSHLLYRDRLREFGPYAADRAADEKRFRDKWDLYVAGTWALSAVDYWIRPRLDLESSSPTQVTISAPPLSRGAVVWRSMLVPGAGQDFANSPGRGAFWLGATLAAGAGFIVAEGMVEREQTKLDWARAMIDSVGPSERPARQREAEQRKSDLQSNEDFRRGMRYAMIGCYVANLIDALLIPIHAPATPARRVSTAIPVSPDGAAVQVTVRF
jgi:hypothetical protein